MGAYIYYFLFFLFKNSCQNLNNSKALVLQQAISFQVIVSMDSWITEEKQNLEGKIMLRFSKVILIITKLLFPQNFISLLLSMNQ